DVAKSLKIPSKTAGVDLTDFKVMDGVRGLRTSGRAARRRFFPPSRCPAFQRREHDTPVNRPGRYT
ncbi:hypothetical protein, partial [Streptomyces flavidovirens]